MSPRMSLAFDRMLLTACAVEWIRLARIAWRAATPATARRFIEWESRAS